MHSKYVEHFQDQIFFYILIIIWLKTATDVTCSCPTKASSDGLYFPWCEIWWALGAVVFLLSRRGRWPKHFISRLPCCIVVEACLNCRAARETGEVLMENTNVLRPWGSAAEVSAALLSAKDLETGQKRRVQRRLQRIQRGGAEHECHFLFLILIKRRENHFWFQSPGPQPGRGPICSGIIFFLLRGMFVVWNWCCKISSLEVESLGAWLHNAKQTGSEMQNPVGGLQKRTHSEGRSTAGVWAATAAQLMGPELQGWGVFGVRLHIADAAAAPNPWKPPVGCAVPWTSGKKS